MLDMNINKKNGMLLIKLKESDIRTNGNFSKNKENLLSKLDFGDIIFNINRMDNNCEEKGNTDSKSSILICVEENEEITEKINFLLNKVEEINEEVLSYKN